MATLTTPAPPLNPFATYAPPDTPPTDIFPDPANNSMEHIFLPLRQQWVWDFFFESSHQEADMLHYAVSDQFITLADFDISTGETADPYANKFRVGEKHRILLLPSFSTGNLSVGFGVSERITSSSSFACRERYTGRIVRDDENACCLFIAEDFNINMVEVSYFSLRSPSQRHHCFMLFHSKEFHSAIRSIRSEYDHNAVKEALMYHYNAIEGRPCPNCGGGYCSCKLSLTPKRHPLDKENEIANVHSFTGHYGGVASLGLYAKGNNIFLARYNTTSGIRLNADFSLQQRLALWALCAAAQKRPVNPLKLIMTEAAGMKNRAVTATDTFLIASLAEAVVDEDEQDKQPQASDGVMTSVSNMLANGMPGPGVGVGGAIAQVSAAASLSGFDVNTMFNDACELTAGGDLDFIPVVEECNDEGSVGTSDPVSTAPSVSEGYSMSGDKASRDDVEMTDSSACLSRISHSHTPPKHPNLVPPAPVPQQPLSQPMPVSQPAPIAQQTQPLLCPLPQRQNGKIPIARPLLPLAPAVATEPEQRDQVTAEMDERRRKAELRKARNRESAQRSNLKRKMQIQKLKEEIDAASTRESYLRAKEKMLREENLSLRTAVFR